MGKLMLDITMSLDGFIAGPNDDLDRVHDWIRGNPTDEGAAVTQELMESTGAVLMGRRTFDLAEASNAWVDGPPIVVLSHTRVEKEDEGATRFTFVTDGIESALHQAQAAADGKDVWVIGGANTAQQYIEAGLLDEMQIHLVSVLLGDGIRLFDHIGAGHKELERTRVKETPGVTHLSFRFMK